MMLAELIVALAIASVALVVLLDNFSSNQQLAMATRERSGALLLANNLKERVLAHPYGMPAPQDWPGSTPPAGDWDSASVSNPSVIVLAAGSVQQPAPMRYYQQLSFQNGSAIAQSLGDTDTANLVISWRERGALRSLSVQILLRRTP